MYPDNEKASNFTVIRNSTGVMYHMYGSRYIDMKRKEEKEVLLLINQRKFQVSRSMLRRRH